MVRVDARGSSRRTMHRRQEAEGAASARRRRPSTRGRRSFETWVSLYFRARRFRDFDEAAASRTAPRVIPARPPARAPPWTADARLRRKCFSPLLEYRFLKSPCYLYKINSIPPAARACRRRARIFMQVAAEGGRPRRQLFA
ncbi:hypothetical protein EVAR_65644_1 [Eumeta japonica]|uniref:Uncharacterized protein n=1 Tax=Eumeta variegata TaxID=151549 RepID=A0A4C1Z4M9_EUMVA|nr:hypothetical protein EVAR_65644_1 [Eumeta japonica]